MHLDIISKIRYLNGTNDDLRNIIPLRVVRTNHDKHTLEQYSPMFTYQEWIDEFPGIDPDKVYYGLPALAPCHIVYCDIDKYIYLVLDQFIAQPELMPAQAAIDAIKHLERFYSHKLYRKLLRHVPGAAQLQYLDHLLCTINDSSGFPLFIDFYSSSDFGFECMSIDTIRHCFKNKNAEQIEKTQKKLSELPDEIKIYRGAADNSTPLNKTASWTTDINIAYKFAIMSDASAQVYEAVVAKEHVVDFLPNHGESEIIALPEHVHITGSTAIYHVGEVDLLNESSVRLYQLFRARLKQVPFVQDSELHGKLHCLHVLFYSLLIAQHEGLSLDALMALCMAAIYHDSGRCHDGVDDTHGEAGRKVYVKDVAVPDPKVSVMIRYHCLDDTTSAKGIEKRLSKEFQKAFWILKDADALDRVRFDLSCLDIKQLRFAYSRSLVLVAVQSQNNLEL